MPSPASALAGEMHNHLTFVAPGHPGQPVPGFTAVSGASSAKMETAARFAALAGPQHWIAGASLAAASRSSGSLPAPGLMGGRGDTGLPADDSHGSADTYGLPSHIRYAGGGGLAATSIGPSLAGQPQSDSTHSGSLMHGSTGSRLAAGYTHANSSMLGGVGAGGHSGAPSAIPGLNGSPMASAQRTLGGYPATLSSDERSATYERAAPALQQHGARDVAGDSSHIASKRMREQLSQASLAYPMTWNQGIMPAGSSDIAMRSELSMQYPSESFPPPGPVPTHVSTREQRKRCTADLMGQAFAADPKGAVAQPGGAFVYVPAHLVDHLAIARAVFRNEALIMDWDEMTDIVSVALHGRHAASRMHALAATSGGRLRPRDPAPFGDAVSAMGPGSASSSPSSSPVSGAPGTAPAMSAPVSGALASDTPEQWSQTSATQFSGSSGMHSGVLSAAMVSGASNYGGTPTAGSGVYGVNTDSSCPPAALSDPWGTGVPSMDGRGYGYSPAYGQSAAARSLAAAAAIAAAAAGSQIHAFGYGTGSPLAGWAGWAGTLPPGGRGGVLLGGATSHRSTPPADPRYVAHGGMGSSTDLAQRMGATPHVSPAMLSALAAGSRDSTGVSPTFTGTSALAAPDTSGLHALSLAAGELTTAGVPGFAQSSSAQRPATAAAAAGQSSSSRPYPRNGDGRVDAWAVGEADEDGDGSAESTARMRRAMVLDSRVAEGTRTGTVSSKDGVSWGRVNNPVIYVEDSGLPPSWPRIPIPRNYLHTNLPPEDGRSGRLTKQSVATLRRWMTHGHTWLSPYPTTSDVSQLSVETGMSAKQLRDWFRNERKRVWLPFWQSRLSDPSCPWVVQRSSGGRANIIPSHVISRFESYTTELDLMTAIALDKDAVDDGSANWRSPAPEPARAAATVHVGDTALVGQSPGTASARSLPGTEHGSMASQGQASMHASPMSHAAVPPPRRSSATLMPVDDVGVAVYPTVTASVPFSSSVGLDPGTTRSSVTTSVARHY